MQEIHLMSEVDLITLICLVDNLVLLCDLCTIIRKKHKNSSPNIIYKSLQRANIINQLSNHYLRWTN